MHTPGMHTPRGLAPPPGQGMGQKYPSMQSVHSLLSQGYLPPGHGYVPKPIKPDKPYGPTFITVMNRTWRGPGQKYLHYALFTFSLAILFLLATGLYWGHRNVSRMIVLRTECFGAIFTIIFICLVGLMFHFIYRARQESNRWRSHVRFKAEGLYKVVAFNRVYAPEDETALETGTYGKRALKEIPKPGRRGRGRGRGRGRAGSAPHTPGTTYGGQRPIPEEGPPTPNYPPPPPVQASSKPRFEWPGQRGAYVQKTQYSSAPQSRQSAYQVPVDQRMDPRKYGGQQKYSVAGATEGKQGESLS